MRSSLLEDEDEDWEFIDKAEFNNTSFQCYEKPVINHKTAEAKQSAFVQKAQNQIQSFKQSETAANLKNSWANFGNKVASVFKKEEKPRLIMTPADNEAYLNQMADEYQEFIQFQNFQKMKAMVKPQTIIAQRKNSNPYIRESIIQIDQEIQNDIPEDLIQDFIEQSFDNDSDQNISIDYRLSNGSLAASHMIEHDELAKIQHQDPAARIKKNQRQSTQHHLKKRKDFHQIEQSSLVDPEGHQPQENHVIGKNMKLIRKMSENEPQTQPVPDNTDSQNENTLKLVFTRNPVLLQQCHNQKQIGNFEDLKQK